MTKQNNSSEETSDSARILTTLLALCWGTASSCLLYYHLLILKEIRPCLAAIVPLVAVWATLERKRWGRLVMLFISFIMLLLMLIGICALLNERCGVSVLAGLSWIVSLPVFHFLGTDYPIVLLFILPLSALTVIWLQIPTVVQEFECGKKNHLLLGQFIIAAPLVTLWGLSLLITPSVSLATEDLPIAYAGRAGHSGHYSSLWKRPGNRAPIIRKRNNLSAESPNSR